MRTGNKSSGELELTQQESPYFAKNNQLNRYLEQLREEMHRARRQLLEKESYITLIKETADGLQQAYRDIQTVYNLSENIVKIRKPQQIIESFVAAVAQILPIRAGAFFRYEPSGDSFFLIYDYQLDQEIREFIRKHQVFSYYRWALNERRPIVLPEPVRFGPAGENDCSAVLIPVVQGEKIMGLLDVVVRKTAEEFSQRDFDLLSILSNHAAVAIENAELYETMTIKSEALSNMKNYLTNVLQGMSNGVLVVNDEGRVQLINKNTERMLNLRDVDPVGYHLLEVLSDAVGVKLHELYKKVMAEGSQASDELEVETTDGKRMPVSINCNPLFNEEEVAYGAIFVLHDMTETYELIKLKKIDRLKDQLISNISHELRTPLTAIKSFSEILLNYEEEDEETRREFLSIINSESDRLTRLINNILDLSKLESNTAKWQMEPLDLEMIIDAAVDTLQSLLLKKNIQLEKKYAGNLPPVFGDRDKLTQVMVNLVNNAIKFSPEGGRITLLTELHAEETPEKARIRVGVIDEGPGIPPQYLDLIFEKFGQVLDSNDGNKPSGTGLGLTISREIIHHLGGRIWVESEEGQGARFYFELPVMPEDAEQVEKVFGEDQVTVVRPNRVVERSELEAEVEEEEEQGEEEEPDAEQRKTGGDSRGQ